MKKLISFVFVIAIMVCSISSVFAVGKYGDVDNNGTVNVFDATSIQNHIAEVVLLSDDMLVLADVDDDGSVTIMDVTEIQYYAAKYTTSFPADKNNTLDPTAPTEEPTTPTEAPTTEQSPNAYELEVLRLVNIEREKEGLEPYEFGYHIYDCAKLRAEELLVTFSHVRPDGTSCFTVFSELGVTEPFMALGENIAMGHTSPEDVVNAWMNSPGHRANILDPVFEQLAVGVCEIPNAPGRYATVQLFWTSY